ncbi:Riboflavin transporter MCH5 [Grifola frondosa]|uniref:Riboflavin transporter MCH5 n=1 Tax=Grifola frondosa TaxID=5627 RepID=A0A1C7MIE0_GRIFR|nr:Riboflavin transporter MCH5 [Grifola frondosa]
MERSTSVTTQSALAPEQELIPVDKGSAVNSAATEFASDGQPPVDGGLQAWSTVLGGCIAGFCTFGAANSFGVYQAFYTLEGTSSASNISWIGSVQLYLIFLVGLPAGKLFDLGYFHHLQVAGTIIYALSMFMLSLANTSKYYQLFLTQGIGIGLGSGLIYVPAVSVQAHHWTRKRSLALGILNAGSSCGGVVYPIMLNKLINGRVGFAWGVRASAILTLGLLIISNVSMTTRTKHIKDLADAAGHRKRIKEILNDGPFWMTTAAGFMAVLGLYIPYFYIQLFVKVNGLSPNLAFYSLAMMNTSSFFGRLILNYTADHIGPYTVICYVSVISAALVFVMFAATKTAGVILFTILYGFFSGGSASLLPVALASLSKDLSEVGLRIGVGFCVSAFGLLIGNPIAGALLTPDFYWTDSSYSVACVPFSSTCLLTEFGHWLPRWRCSPLQCCGSS